MVNSLGVRITELRKAAGLTQDQLGEKLSISGQAVSKWENDQSCPDISALPLLAEYLNVSIDELLCGERTMAEVRVLPQSQRKDINRMMIRLNVRSHEGDIVKMNIPVTLVKAFLEFGMQSAQISNNNAIRNIDFNMVMQSAENGVIGKILEVHSADGDDVELFIE